MSARHLVLGTAGHIDHGKSALVRALTGIDPDRLLEERLRGITIDLGFADVEIAPGRVLSFVDVPGHERFVRHMIAGATGIDAVLLVVAADQGVQPQTREHVDICSLLRIPRGVVALTKLDLVDAELAEVVALEVGELLEAGSLAGAPIVPVSARSGAGLDALRDALAALCDELPARASGGVARLAVDRSFVMHGFGTVVTGTLTGGALREGQEIEVLPGGRRGRIRGLQVHRERVERAEAGRRTAVNLQGLDRAEVPRGSTLTEPGMLSTTRRVWARVEWLGHARDALRRGGAVRFHHGTCERWARLRPLPEAGEGPPPVEIRLDEETLVLPGDRFVLRRPAPLDTIGGGVVLDAHPPAAREACDEDLGTAGTPAEEALRRELRRASVGGAEPAELTARIGIPAASLEALARSMEGEGALVRAGSRWFDGPAWRETEAGALEALERFHEREPLHPDLPRETLRAGVAPRMPLDAWKRMLQGLAGRGEVRLAGDSIARGRHEVVLDGADLELSEAIEARFRAAGLEPPEPDEVLGRGPAGHASKILDLLLKRGTLVRIEGGKIFHAAALDDLKEKLRRHAATAPTIDVATFKELAGVTRKNAIPLLEHLDAERATRRVGNLREIRLDPKPRD